MERSAPIGAPAGWLLIGSQAELAQGIAGAQFEESGEDEGCEEADVDRL